MTDDAPATAAASRTPTRLPFALGLLAVALLTVATFAHTLGFEFVNWDDPTNVYENPLYLPVTADGIAYFWANSYFELYMPVTYTLWGLCAALGASKEPVFNSGGEPMPFSPAPFHALNLAFHVGSALLVFGLLWRLAERFGPGVREPSPGWRAFACAAGALLFALHPVQVESVAWVTGANNVVSGFFGLLALWFYLSYAEGRRPALSFTMATASFGLALLSKPTATALPLVVAVLEAVALRRPWRRWAPGLLVWVALAGGMVLATRAGSGSSQQATLPVFGRPFIAGDALAFYLGKIGFPWELSVDYGRKPSLVLGSWWGYATWLVPAGLGLLLWRLRARLRWAGAGLLILVAATLPVLGFVPFYLHFTNTVGDRYLYLAMLGPALALTWALWRFGAGGQARRTLAVGVGALLLIFGARAWGQARYWRDSVTLFTRILSVHPESQAAFTNLGIALASWRGNEAGLEAALRALPFAWEERPGEVGPGVPPDKRRQLLAALECFQRAAAAQPEVARNHYHVGATLVELHRPSDAVAPFQEAVRLYPPFAEAWFRLGTTLGQMKGRTDEAIEALTKAVELDPKNVDAHYIRAVLLGNRGAYAAAEAGFETAARLAPGYAEPHFGIARMLEKQGRLQAAVTEYREAARLAPGNARFADALREAERRVPPQ